MLWHETIQKRSTFNSHNHPLTISYILKIWWKFNFKITPESNKGFRNPELLLCESFWFVRCPHKIIPRFIVFTIYPKPTEWLINFPKFSNINLDKRTYNYCCHFSYTPFYLYPRLSSSKLCEQFWIWNNFLNSIPKCFVNPNGSHCSIHYPP